MFVPLLLIVTWLGADVLAGEVADGPSAQARLAEALADADAIDAVTVRGDVVSFTIDHHVGERFTVDARRRVDGEVTAVTIRDAGPRAEPVGMRGRYDWLAREAVGIETVHAVLVDDDGNVTIAAGDGRRYLVIPDRGDGNSAVEARWGGEWNNS